ncbi:steroidogenic acute regulatory protein-like [Haematobia irritans]|uniref:steroidogenic acute regulatory protein-like n=1 Tax=Haematobia irritans TaxID=7368 RepID=UPI003F4FB0D7
MISSNLKMDDEVYHKQALNCVRRTYDLLCADDWQVEKITKSGETISSLYREGYGKIYKLTCSLKYPAKALCSEIYDNIEEVPKWNPTMLESKVIKAVMAAHTIAVGSEPEHFVCSQWNGFSSEKTKFDKGPALSYKRSNSSTNVALQNSGPFPGKCHLEMMEISAVMAAHTIAVGSEPEHFVCSQWNGFSSEKTKFDKGPALSYKRSNSSTNVALQNSGLFPWKRHLEMIEISKINSYTEIGKQALCCGGGAGLIKSRDFVNLCCWRLIINGEIQDEVMTEDISKDYKESSKYRDISVSDENLAIEQCYRKNGRVWINAAMSLEYEGAPEVSKFVRGENLITGFAACEVENNTEICIFEWILCLDLKGYIPRYLLDKCYTTFMTDYMKHFYKYIDNLRQNHINKE